MNFKTLLKIGVRNLVQSRNRTWVLVFGIAAVAFLTTFMMSLTAGIQQSVFRSAESLSSGHINIAGFTKLSQSSATPIITHREQLKQIARLVLDREVPNGTARLIERVKSYGKVISETDSIMIPLWGVDYSTEGGLLDRLAIVEGDVSSLKNRGTIGLFANQVKKLKVKVGDSVTLSIPTYRNQYNTMDVRVTVVFKDLGFLSNFCAFFHEKDAREIYRSDSDTTGQWMIYLKDPSQQNRVENALRKAIPEAGFALMEKEAQPFWMKFDRVAGESWTGLKVDITTWQDEMQFTKWIIDILKAITWVLTAVLMSIVAVGLMNVLWISIRERTSEIGTLRAVGMQRKWVLRMFLVESWVLASCSAILGIALASLLALVLHQMKIPVSNEAFQLFLMSSAVEFKVQVVDLGLVFVVIVFFAMVGAWVPAWRAARMKPVTAMQSVDA